MKSIKERFASWLKRIGGRWSTFSIKEQRRYTLVLLAVYAILTLFVVLHVFFEVGKPNRGLLIRHIDNAAIRKAAAQNPRQDTLINALKNERYERKK